MNISNKDFGALAVFAIRYCQGRQSYAPGLVRRIIMEHIQDVSDNDLQVMINDCVELERIGCYGSETIDKIGWLQWHEFLKQEQNKRKEN